MIESTCTGAMEYGPIVYYSHLVPIGIILVLSFFVLIRSNFSSLSKTFFIFNMLFAIWLTGDIVTWVSTNFDLISFAWAPLDYINILAFLFSGYFFLSLVIGRDPSIHYKILLVVLSLPSWSITILNKSIVSFDVSQCQAFNNIFSSQYKLSIEILVIVFIIFVAMYSAIKIKDSLKRKSIITVSVALTFFLLVFSTTEYISSITGIYNINLYSLFILPLFLFVIIFSVTNLRMFNIRIESSQLLVYVMIILVGSQFFFLENTTNKVLTSITFVLSLSFGIVLIRDGRREIEQRLRIETLASDLQIANTRLLELDKQKSEFVSFATHQLRAPLTAMKGYTSLIIEGELGSMSDEVRKAVGRIYESSNTLANIINDYLNISRIELGTMKYTFSILDLKDMVGQVIEELKPSIDKKGLNFSFNFGKTESSSNSKTRFMVRADRDKMKQVISNLIDNSLKYTPSGSIEIVLSRNIENRKVLFIIKDTGMGIAPEVMPKLFSKFVRSTRANQQNIYGTGLGLYLAKQIVASHRGRIWAESEGEGKGSSFFLELDMEV